LLTKQTFKTLEMKKISLVAMIALAALSFQACNNAAKDSKETADSTNAVKDTTTTAATGIAVDANDAKFATDVANGGLAEVALGKLAAEKATNAQVKEFANMMVTDHGKANEELMAIAKTKNITLPVAPDADHQKTMTDLSAKTGTEFDKAYVDAMVDGHKKTAALLEDGSKNCKDTELMAFATKTLPVVKAHLAKIEAIQKTLK
jgi:putative membrane protein